MRYAAFGAVAGGLVTALAGWPVSSLWPSAGVGAILVYLVSCAVLPFARCPLCGDRRRRSDEVGNYRARNCVVCGDEPYMRVGARLMGLGRE